MTGDRQRPLIKHPFFIALASTALFLLALALVPMRYAYTPSAENALNDWPRHSLPLTEKASGGSRAPASVGRNGEVGDLVRIDEKTLALGRTAYHDETYGNEVFLSDVLGLLDGALTPSSFIKALVDLKGEGTTNLKVEIAKDTRVGDRVFLKGQLIDTGLDVPKGAYSILGMKITKSGTRIRAGITCAACHSTVDERTKRVIHGAPNWDLNAGILLALASNSAAYFPHTHVNPAKLPRDKEAKVPLQTGGEAALPDPEALEKAVDEDLLHWPPGHFDSMIDMKAAPTKLPSAFTLGNWPYGFSGAFMAGPFKGLSVQTNNVHGLDSDTTVHAMTARTYFSLDPAEYLAIILRNSAAESMRYDPSIGVQPFDFLRFIDETPGSPGVSQVVALPTYPRATLASPTSLWNADPGSKVWEKVNAMSAWQNSLIPPRADLPNEPELFQAGRKVFERARCQKCHDGPYLTNHRVIPASLIKTQPLRAKALKKTELIKGPAIGYSFDQSVPLPRDSKTFELTTALPIEQVKLSLGWGRTQGGYKVPALIGLYWTAPYLHDGAVAVGDDEDVDLGVPGTSLKHRKPDPAKSLRALVDRSLRAKVIAANHRNPDLRKMNIEGIGHSYWVDERAGFTKEDQQALIYYLLTLQPPIDDEAADR